MCLLTPPLAAASSRRMWRSSWRNLQPTRQRMAMLPSQGEAEEQEAEEEQAEEELAEEGTRGPPRVRSRRRRSEHHAQIIPNLYPPPHKPHFP